MRFEFTFALFISFVSTACGNSVGPDDANADASDIVPADGADGDASQPPIDAAGRVPMNHRVDNSLCLTQAPPGDCRFPGYPMSSSSGCSMDSQCAEGGASGRCVQIPSGIAICECSFDACTTDDMCSMGGPCACHGSAYNAGGNVCVPGDCHVDADCGTNGFCSPSVNLNGCGALGGYYCHTNQDACIDDSDCGSMGFLGTCAYIDGDHRWECRARPACA